MTQAREAILARIRVATRLQPDEKPTSIFPAYTQKSHAELISLFVTQATLAGTTIETLPLLTELPERLIALLKQLNFPPTVRLSKNVKKMFCDQNNMADFKYTEDTQALISITDCVCGIAETGSIVVISGEDPMLLNCVPDLHIVLLNKAHIVATLEAAFAHIPQQPLPRAINFITGPSRTGDIEQKILLGVHGPRYLTVFLYERDE